MVLDPSAFQGTVISGVILAGIARTLIPYLAKRSADDAAGVTPRPFSIGYIITGALAIIPVAVGATLLLPTILPNITNGGTQLMVFVTAFGLAYASTDLVNRNVSTLTNQSILATGQAGKQATTTPVDLPVTAVTDKIQGKDDKPA
jgi:hypothetical protein